MEDIIEEYGLGFLQILAGLAMLAVFGAFLIEDGGFAEIVRQYLYGISG